MQDEPGEPVVRVGYEFRTAPKQAPVFEEQSSNLPPPIRTSELSTLAQKLQVGDTSGVSVWARRTILQHSVL